LSGCGGNCGGGCGCAGGSSEQAQGLSLIGGWLASRSRGNPVLGPNLGGGFSGGGLSASTTIPVPGGGFTPPITHVLEIDPVAYPQVRQDYIFDYSSTVALKNGRPLPADTALDRSFGGLR